MVYMTILAAAAVLLGLLLILVTIRPSENRKNALRDFITVLIGTFVGFSLALAGADWQRNVVASKKVAAILSSGRMAVDQSLPKVERLVSETLQQDEGEVSADSEFNELLAQVRNLSTPLPMLQQLVNEGDFFEKLSPTFQGLVHSLIALTAVSSDWPLASHSIPVIRLHARKARINLRYVGECLDIERDYVLNIASSTEEEQRLSKAAEEFTVNSTVIMAEEWFLRGDYLEEDSWWGDRAEQPE